MDKIKTVIIAFVLLVVLVFLIFFAFDYLKPQSSALAVESIPASTVFINGQQVGRTPYSGNLKPGEVILRLVPEGVSDPFGSYETKITLESGVKTIVRRNFGDTSGRSAGEIISFIKVPEKEASVSVVSAPDAAQVSLDGVVRGFTPIKLSNIVAGEHQLTITAPNHLERGFNIRTIEGYKLIVIAKLAENVAPTPAPVLSAEESIVEVKILDTPTGFLNIRSEPNSASTEIGRATPGLRYKLVETDEKTGWFKIEFDEGSGWISNRYAAVEDPDN